MRKPECHPDRRHQAKGLCDPCYSRAWRAAHPEQSRAIKRAWIARNPDYHPSWYRANRERIAKVKSERHFSGEAARHRPATCHPEREDKSRGLCSSCAVLRARNATPESREAHRAYVRALRLRKTYGVSAEEYERRHHDQGGLCAICAEPETRRIGRRLCSLSVDHDHATGAVRGLLCNRCNTAIGKLGDRPDLLTKAIDYLARSA